MKKYKYIFKNLLYFFGILLAYLLIFTTLNYLNLISYKTLCIISFIFTIILFFLNGFTIALKAKNKGYISGLIIGLITITIFLILAFILKTNPKVNSLIYFLILILSSTFGGMIGINYKKN